MSIKKQFLKSKPVCKVTFTLPAEEAKSVAVVGSFNEWNTDATPLKKLKNGSFKGTIDLESGKHRIKDMAILLLKAMNDWPTYNQVLISEFTKEFKTDYIIPLTMEQLQARKFNGQNAWNLEAQNSIIEMMVVSNKFFDETDFDKTIDNILNYYEKLRFESKK